MRIDNGAAMIVYRVKEKNQREYLILKRDKNWSGWEIPKGHLEFGDHSSTVFVELNEEVGIEPIHIQNIRETGENLTFSFEQDEEQVISDFKCFHVEVSRETPVKLSQNPSQEHSDYRWATREEAAEMLEHEEQRELLLGTKRKKGR